MLSNDNAFLNTYASDHTTNIRKNMGGKVNGNEGRLTRQINPFNQRTLFARFKIRTDETPDQEIHEGSAHTYIC